MKKILPQELEVWFVLPAIRRELTKDLIESHKISQKEVAEVLGITDAAVSQYLHAKRGGTLKFKPGELAKIRAVAKKIMKDKKKSMHHISLLSKELIGSKTICELHRTHDASIPKNCAICK